MNQSWMRCAYAAGKLWVWKVGLPFGAAAGAAAAAAAAAAACHVDAGMQMTINSGFLP
jgi:hypothetical protein